MSKTDVLDLVRAGAPIERSLQRQVRRLQRAAQRHGWRVSCVEIDLVTRHLFLEARMGTPTERFRRERHCDVDRIVYQRLFGKSPREVTP